ncbi:MAG TPA: biotin--[acetyl-CoA-carboxylase] ligase [Phycisphaerae bacterium]|nr:biotin--[acetyl-CoA-carboxylase] ligase [Phycisphaerae bacterium]
MDARVSLALRGRRSASVAADVLAAELGLAPRQVVAAVEDLGRYGFVIESHPIEGFRLVAAPERLFDAEVVSGLGVSRVGRRVRCLGTVSSTNDLAWQAAEQGPDETDGLAILAEYQTAGRGRRGNRWVAPPHTSVLCSVVLWVPQVPRQGGVLTRAAALAVAEAIEQQCRLSVGIRWPNDLVVDDRKIAGILVEARPASDGGGPVVVGAGINCSQPEEAFPADIRPHVASLAMLGEDVDRTLLARGLLVALDRAVEQMADDRGIGDLARRAAARCRTLGRRITVSDGQATFSGEVLDLDPDYELVLRLAEGGIRHFPAMTTHVLSRGST